MRLRISFPLAATAGLIAALGIVAVISILAWSSLSTIVKSLGEASRPNLRLAMAKDIAYALSDAENTVQAYIVAPDSASLDPYLSALATVDARMDSFQRATPPSQAEGSRSLDDTLALIVGQKFAVLDSLLRLDKPDFLDSALNSIAKNLKEGPKPAALATAATPKPSKDKGAPQPPTPAPSPASAEPEKSGIFKRIFNKKKTDNSSNSPTPESQPVVEPTPTSPSSKPAKESNVDFRRIQRQIKEVQARDQAQSQLAQQRGLSLIRRSQDLSNHLRRIIADIEREESAYLQKETEDSEASANTAYTIIGFFTATAALLLCVVGYNIFAFVRHTAAQRRMIQYAKEQAEQLAEDRERFVATMSHEIRTPMNAILGFSDQMLKGDLSPDQRRNAEIVKDSSNHLLEIVNSVLDFTQLSAGKLKFAAVGFKLREESAFIIELLRQTATKKGISLKLQMAREVPEVIIGDPLRYRQVLLNLLNNAIKFTEHGGVTLRLSTEGAASALLIQVHDTGIGIPKDKLESIFGEYEQVDAQTKQRFGGTGLGLSITRMILIHQGGSIRAESELGKGTTFHARLPFVPGNTADLAQKPNIRTETLRPGLRVLVADDEAYNRLLLTTMLKAWSATWVEAEDGQAALKAFESQPFDVVLLDMKMPLLTGHEVAERIRALSPAPRASTPIIALTAGATEAEKAAFARLGIQFVLPKPIDEAELASAIRSAMKGDTLGDSGHFVANPQGPRDLRQLMSLAHGNIAFVEDLVNTYTRSLRASLPEIQDHLKAGKLQPASEVCHRLVPPSRHIEAAQLANMLRELENGCIKGDDSAKLKDLANRIEQEAETVLKALDTALANLRAAG